MPKKPQPNTGKWSTLALVWSTLGSSALVFILTAVLGTGGLWEFYKLDLETKKADVEKMRYAAELREK